MAILNDEVIMKVCNLASGSKGNCTFIQTKKHNILIDVGVTTLYIENNLKEIGIDPNSIDLVLITHSHTDHTGGLKVFNNKYHPNIYISPKILKETKLDGSKFNILDSLDEIKDIKITEIQLSHDVSDIKGYIIEEDNSSMVYITDTGYINKNYFDILSNRSLYIFESNHDVEKLMHNPKYPHHIKIRILSDKGHLSNEDATYYLLKLIGDNTKEVVLAHLSEENNTEELAYNTLKNKLDKNAHISIARQNERSEIFEI